MMNLDLTDLKDDPVKSRHVTFRIPEEDYQKLKQYDGNVSNLMRYLVEAYLHEKANEERINKWTSPKL